MRMKILINIPEERLADIQRIASVQSERRVPSAEQIIANGTPLSSEPEQRWISEQDMTDKLTRLINEFEMIMSDIREKEVDDSVCGLCEYDADHGMDGYANECPGFEKDDCFRLKDEYRKQWMSMNY